MKKFILLFFAFISINISLFSQSRIKNIIFMIPDGTSVDLLALARWYNNGQLLAVDPYICGLVKTHCSDTPIGDSAPTGSTYSTGHLSQTGFVATYPEKVMDGMNIINTNKEKAFSPMFTILEAAKLQCKSTGLVFTCYFPHATPADFSAHSQNRDNYELLSKQMVYNNIDVVFGGGMSYLLPEKRKDKLDLTKVLKQNGTTLIQTPSQMNAFTGKKIWGLFAPKSLRNDIDRDTTKEPSLAEMTVKAIEILSKDTNGFFMMVEGSKVDWSAHDNDPIGMVTEFLAFDKAVNAAIEFAKRDGNTIVVVCPDHSNSGISIGNRKSNNNYDNITLRQLIEPLQKAKKTAEAIYFLISEKSTNEEIVNVFKIEYGINDLKQSEIDTINSYFKYSKQIKDSLLKKNPLDIVKITSSIITSRTYIGFTTYGHTGEDVFLSIYDPTNNRPTGLVKNDELNKYLCKTFNNVNLDSLTDVYYVPHYKVFNSELWSIDSTNKENIVLKVKSKKNRLEIPANKNIVIVNGKEIQFPTLMIYNGIYFYIPKELSRYLEE